MLADDVLVKRRGKHAYSHFAVKGLVSRSAVSAADFARLDLGLLQPTLRADLLTGLRFPEHIHKTGDFMFWFRAVKRAGGLSLCQTLGYYHRRRPNSVSEDSPALWMQARSSNSGADVDADA